MTCNLPLTISSLALLALFHLVTALLVRPKKRNSPLFAECREMFERAGYAYVPMVFVLAPEFGVLPSGMRVSGRLRSCSWLLCLLCMALWLLRRGFARFCGAPSRLGRVFLFCLVTQHKGLHAWFFVWYYIGISFVLASVLLAFYHPFRKGDTHYVSLCR